MTNNLERMRREVRGGGAKHRPKGWTLERRTRQAALIRGWQPWRRSTGPKTEAGKARSSMNALKHGFRSQATIQEYRRVRYALRLAARNIEILRLYIRTRDAHPDLKPLYAKLLSAKTDSLAQFMERARAEKISNDRTIESGNRPTPPISYGRAAERPRGYGRLRATSLGGRERGPVFPSPKRVGRRLVTPEPRSGEGGKRSPP